MPASLTITNYRDIKHQVCHTYATTRSMRKTAEICSVALGTVWSYVHEDRTTGILTDEERKEIEVMYECEREAKRADAIEKWEDLRQMALERALSALPVIPIVDAADLQRVSVSAGIATEKAAALAGEPLGVVEHRHRHSGTVKHIAVLPPKQITPELFPDYEIIDRSEG